MTPNYSDWTLALYQALLENRPTGEAIYLQIDTEVLEFVAYQQVEQNLWTDQHQTSWTEQFIKSVKKHLGSYYTLDLHPLNDYYLCPPQPNDQAQGNPYSIQKIARPLLPNYEIYCPLSLGFLAFQVLVATQMQSDQTFSSSNYYSRLEQFLNGASFNQNEQRQLAARLWQKFNHWLRLRGWITTAHEGQGPQRFIRYPISQCLLREGDRQKLQQVLNQTCRQNQSMGPERFNYWVAQHQQQLTQHVQNILSQESALKRKELLEELYATYLDRAWLDFNGVRQQRQQRRLTAGLYRYENFFTGELEYRPYPQMRRLQSFGGQLTTLHQGKTLPLSFHRPGFYHPLPIALKNPAEPVTFPLQGSTDLKELVFSGSDTWALVADPLAPNSGVYATWNRPVPGEPFYFLCLEKFNKKLVELKTLGLIDWDEKLMIEDLKANHQSHWYEYKQMRILEIQPARWQKGFLPPELSYWLLPQQRIGLTVNGGLSTRGSGDYMCGFPIQLKILASQGEYTCLLKELSQDTTQTFTQVANQPFEFTLTTPGCYELTISGPEGNLFKRFNAISWNDLRPRQDKIQRYHYILDEEGKLLMEGGYICHD